MIACSARGKWGRAKRGERKCVTTSVHPALHLVMIFDLSDRRKRYLDDLAALSFHLDTRSSQSLRGFHTPNDAANPPAVEGDDLDVVFPVKRLKCRKCFSDFHSFSRPFGAHASRQMNSSKPAIDSAHKLGGCPSGSRIPDYHSLSRACVKITGK